jgi:hypothetical protein
VRWFGCEATYPIVVEGAGAAASGNGRLRLRRAGVGR